MSTARPGDRTKDYLIFTLYYALFNYTDCANTKQPDAACEWRPAPNSGQCHGFENEFPITQAHSRDWSRIVFIRWGFIREKIKF